MIFARNYMQPDVARVVTVRVMRSQFEVVYVFPDGVEHRCQTSECPEVDEIATGMLTAEPTTPSDVLGAD